MTRATLTGVYAATVGFRGTIPSTLLEHPRATTATVSPAVVAAVVRRTLRSLAWATRSLGWAARLRLRPSDASRADAHPGSTCLTRAIAVATACRAAGVPVVVRVGARRASAGIEAHAWVELGDVPLTDPGVAMTRLAPTGRAR
ncbi:MAG: lasso peptide biosynthesis B2 protein [Gemmatimonadaceae bacterium]|nr:lasso peptide biosynthesis B2 protein [Gemmatimonadaceae bacterium]